MNRKNLSYDERERRRKEQLAFNDSYLEGFANHLERKALLDQNGYRAL